MFISSSYGATATCVSNPVTDDKDNAIDDGDSFTITCNLGGNQGNNQDHIDSCRFEHYEPLNDQRGNNYAADIECTFAESGQQSNCMSDTRITGSASGQNCQIMVSNSKPEDTGTWTTFVSTVSYV